MTDQLSLSDVKLAVDDLSLLQDHDEESEDGGIIYLCNYQKIKNGI